MIISALAGGLGNQLFQYAAGRSLARRLGVDLAVDVSHFAGPQRPAGLEQFGRSVKLMSFRVAAPVATPEQVRAVRDRYRRTPLLKAISGPVRRRWKSLPLGHYRERSLRFDPVFHGLPDRTYLDGYFQSERYFSGQEESIRREFQFRDATLDEFGARFVASYRRPGGPVVAVHVRRGDIAYGVERLGQVNLVSYRLIPAEYFQRAMALFSAETTFLVFSDSAADLDWCRVHVTAPRIHYCYGNTDMQDFAIMRHCDHNILANGTFGWWAAWLNETPGKRVLTPGQWFNAGHSDAAAMDTLIPTSWEIL